MDTSSEGWAKVGARPLPPPPPPGKKLHVGGYFFSLWGRGFVLFMWDLFSPCGGTGHFLLIDRLDALPLQKILRAPNRTRNVLKFRDDTQT